MLVVIAAVVPLIVPVPMVAPLSKNVIVPVGPLEIVAVNVTAPPNVEGEFELTRLKVSAVPVPVPLSAIDSGESLALSMMVTTAFKAPTAAGLKCTWIEQVFPAATLNPQPFLKTKEDASAPVKLMLVISRGASPVLVRTTDCEELVVPIFRLAKTRSLTDKDTVGAPVDRDSACGDRETGRPHANKEQIRILDTSITIADALAHVSHSVSAILPILRRGYDGAVPTNTCRCHIFLAHVIKVIYRAISW
jgi:hypothetical protein